MPSNNDPQKVTHLHNLGALDLVPVGTRVYVEEDEIAYIGVGSIPVSIRDRIRWPRSNVWMPEHVLDDVLGKRGQILSDPPAAAAIILSQPRAIWKDNRLQEAKCFVIDGETLREQGLLGSTSTRYVDAIVEFRYVPGGFLMRLFHLSPRKGLPGGTPLWP